MVLFPMTNEDKIRLKRLNDDKALVFALKKLCLNECAGAKVGDVQLLAAERIAQKYIEAIFHELSIVKPDDIISTKDENMV